MLDINKISVIYVNMIYICEYENNDSNNILLVNRISPKREWVRNREKRKGKEGNGDVHIYYIPLLLSWSSSPILLRIQMVLSSLLFVCSRLSRNNGLLS